MSFLIYEHRNLACGDLLSAGCLEIIGNIFFVFFFELDKIDMWGLNK